VGFFKLKLALWQLPVLVSFGGEEVPLNRRRGARITRVPTPSSRRVVEEFLRMVERRQPADEEGERNYYFF